MESLMTQLIYELEIKQGLEKSGLFGVFRGGTGGPPPPRIARFLVFAMLKFSVRPLLGIWTPLRKFSGSAHVLCQKH